MGNAVKDYTIIQTRDGEEVYFGKGNYINCEEILGSNSNKEYTIFKIQIGDNYLKLNREFIPPISYLKDIECPLYFPNVKNIIKQISKEL